MEAKKSREKRERERKKERIWVREREKRERGMIWKKSGQVLCHVYMFGFMFVMPAKLSVYLPVATVITVVSCCNMFIFFIGWVGLWMWLNFLLWNLEESCMRVCVCVCVCLCARARAFLYAHNTIYIWNIEEKRWLFVSFKISISFVNIL